MEVTNSIEAPKDKSSSLASLATMYSRLGDCTRAIAFLEQALTVSDTIDEPSFHGDPVLYIQPLSPIARSAVLLGNCQQPQTLLEPILERLNTIDNDEKSSVLIEIGKAAIQLDDVEKAQSVLVDVLSLTNTISDDELKASTLNEIVETTTHLQPAEQVQIVLEQALMVTNSIDDVRFRDSVLRTIGRAMTDWRSPEEQMEQKSLAKKIY